MKQIIIQLIVQLLYARLDYIDKCGQILEILPHTQMKLLNKILDLYHCGCK